MLPYKSLRLSTYVEADDLDQFKADHVILATGAEPRLDGVQMSHPGEPIEGIGLGHVTSINADLVVFISLNRPRAKMVHDLETKGLSYSLIGDANSPRFLERAVAEGNAAGREI